MMSRMPDNLESKYNHDNKFKWVDSQLEKYMTRQKELEDNIKTLEKENTKLRIALCNLRDEFLDLGGDPKQLELFDKDDVSQLKIFDE
tara:strand:- start:218 stop:481 length:264 start_codon:yes stop_codon:yes gene_type:complete